MLRVSALRRFFASPPRKILFVVVGVERVDCGVMSEQGARIVWDEGGVWTEAVQAVDGASPTASVPASAPASAIKAALHRLQERVADVAVDELRVVVTDHVLAVTSVPWSPSLIHAERAQAYARAQLAGAGFNLDSADVLKLDDAPWGSPRLVVAYPAALVSAFDQWAQRLGARVTSLLPLSVSAWSLVRRIAEEKKAEEKKAEEKKADRAPAQAVAVLDGNALLIARSSWGQPDVLSDVSVRVSDGTARAVQVLSNVWQRLCVREPQWSALGPVTLFALSPSDQGKNPPPFAPIELPQPAWQALVRAPKATPALDARPRGSAFGAAMTSPHRRVMAVAVVVGVMAVLMAAQAVRSVMTTRDLTRALAATQTQQAEGQRTAWSREERAKVQAVNAAVRELNLPIAALLRALEPARDIHVAVLSVETTGGAGGAGGAGGVATEVGGASVRIEAEARTHTDMLRYVAFVSERKPFTRAYLTQHEVRSAAGERPYRFTVEAPWSD